MALIARLIPETCIWITANIDLETTKLDKHELLYVLDKHFEEHDHFQILKNNQYKSGDVCSFIVAMAYEWKVDDNKLMFLVSCEDKFKSCLLKIKLVVNNIIDNIYTDLTFKYLFFDCGGN